MSNKTAELNLEAACRKGDIQAAEKAIKNGANDITRALNIAASNGHLKLCRYLLEEDLPKSRCCGIRTGYKLNMALINACQKGHNDIVEYILDCTRVHDLQVDLREAFYNACDNGHLDTVKIFISKGHYYDFYTGIVGSCISGSLDLVKFFLSIELFINGESIRDAFDYACEEGHGHIIKYLLETPRTRRFIHRDILEKLISRNTCLNSSNIKIVVHNSGLCIDTKRPRGRIKTYYEYISLDLIDSNKRWFLHETINNDLFQLTLK
jgi:ankyrin repeat protein